MIELTVIPQGEFSVQRMFTNGRQFTAFARNSSSGGLWWTGYINGDLACVFGAVPQSLLSEAALFWLHVTPVVARHPIAFARGARVVTSTLLERWPKLIGHCDGGGAKRFLRYLGATFGAEDRGMTTFKIERR